MSSQEVEGTGSGVHAPSAWIVSVEEARHAAHAERVTYITVQAATPTEARNHAIAYATREVFQGRGCVVDSVWLYDHAPEPARSHAIDARTT